jgi:hypothetical protein
MAFIQVMMPTSSASVSPAIIGGSNGLHRVVCDLQLLLEDCMISRVCVVE